MLRSIWSGAFWLALAVLILASASAAEKDKDKAQPPQPTPAEIEAREHVQQALLAETLGDNALRSQRLEAALQEVPTLPEAHWHLGHVLVASQWLPLGAAESAAKEDATLRMYREQRDAAKNPKMAQALARWCVKTGWDEEAKLHYAQVLTSADASEVMRREAMKKLELQRVNGIWVDADEIESRREEAAAMRNALGEWRPRLKKLQLLIDGEDYDLRDQALGELRAIDDPAIIPVLESFLADSRETFQEAAIARLASFPQYESTRALVTYAAVSPFVIPRDRAIAALKSRSPHDYVPLLLAALAAPVKSDYQIRWDAQGRISFTHAFLAQGVSSNQLLLSQELALPDFLSGHVLINDSVRVPLSQPAKSERTTAFVSNGKTPREAFEEQLEAAARSAAEVDQQARIRNLVVGLSNQRLFETLEGATGQKLSREPAAWGQWWESYNEYDWVRPTQYVWRSNAHSYAAIHMAVTRVTGTTHPNVRRSCFLAGTLVRTQIGPLVIEAIKPGDRVLAQDQDTGELTYKLVLRTTVRPPAEMVKIKAGSEFITTTLGHPFWVDGHGWRMAKQLKEGDLLHSIDGAIRIDSVEPLPKPQSAHNLVVADCNTYFVGSQGLLVHDNEYRKPTRSIVPGLAGD